MIEEADATRSQPDAAQGDVVVVLGATGGIGSVLCRRLARRGVRLVLGARRTGPLADLAHECGGIPVPSEALDPASVDALFDTARERFGRVDGSTNLVGSILLKPAHLTTDLDWAATLGTNLGSAFHLLRASVRAMQGSAGSIVLLSSAAARVGLMNHEAIAAAKAGVEGLTRAAAATYARHGIRVNCVAPGLVDTPLSARLTAGPALRKSSAAMHPLGRIGEPTDVASAIDWLIHGEQSWVTGQVLGVDGGLAPLRLRARE